MRWPWRRHLHDRVRRRRPPPPAGRFRLVDMAYEDFPRAMDAAYLDGLKTRAGVSFADLRRRFDACLDEDGASLEACWERTRADADA